MDKNRTERLIRDAAGANFNSIRVWGGGIYPSDDFYDLCDQYGLIVWQDLMFACALYDVKNPLFLENISEEVRDNLLRIRHHACLGMICGNNEMEWFIHDGIEDIRIEPTTREEYIRQYETAFPAIVQEVCPEVFYWPASPSSGGNFQNPNSPERGNVHYWQVWHGGKDYTEYEEHLFRFLSEFGFESFPSMKTIESFTIEEDRNIFSPVMEEHQKCLSGNATILDYIARYFRYPRSLSALFFVSQVSQAEAMRHGIEHLRRNRGISMGTLYWQLNDNWPVASWSSIDYYGRWKALHYVARRSYHNILLSSCIKGDKTQIHLSNESRENIKGELTWKLVNLDGKLVETGEKEAGTAGLSSLVIEEVSTGEYIMDSGEREILLYYEYCDEAGDTYEGFQVYTYYKHLNLRKASIQSNVETTDNGFEISMKTDYPALFVELGLKGHDCVFSDNYFPLLPGANRKIQLSCGDLTVDMIAEEMTIRSLADSY
jgi:beta-mannosidase